MVELSKEQQVQQLQEEYTRRIEEIQQASPELPQEQQENKAVSQVTEGAIQEHLPEFQVASHEPAQPSTVGPDLQTKAQELVNIIWTKSLADSVKSLKDANDPALTDEYHRTLTSNEFWQAMVKEGKIPQL